MLTLIIYETVHGPCVPTVGAALNPDACGNLDPVKELRNTAGKLGATHYDIINDRSTHPQGDLFPRPTLEYTT